MSLTDRVRERERRVATDNYLFKSALRLCRLCRKHLSIIGEPGSLRVDGVVRASDVASFLTEYRAAVRPAGLGSDKALPTADESVLRIFLWAAPVADAVLNDIVRLSLYSDQIVVVDPFSAHFLATNNEPAPLGPHVQPHKWTEHFANLGLMVCALEPWIAKRLVVLIPAPKNFVRDAPPFWQIGVEAMQLGFLRNPPMAEALQDMLEGLALTASDERELAELVDLQLPGLDIDDRLQVLAALGEYRRAHPTRYAPVRLQAGESMFNNGSGQNVFEAAWIADRLGGYVVPRGASDRSIFRNAVRGDPSKDSADALATAFANAPLPMLNNIAMSDALALRESGRLASFRTLLRDVWTASSELDSSPKAIERERHFVDRLTSEYGTAKEEWLGIYKDLGIRGTGTAAALFASGPLAKVIEGGLVPAAVGAGAWLLRNWSQSARTFQRRPSGLLVQLENQSSPNPIRRVLAALERRV